MWQTKNIPTTAMPMATKLGKVATDHEELPAMKLLDPSVTYFCEVTWYIKYFTSLFAIDHWPPNMASWWLTVRGFHPRIHITLSVWVHQRSRDKLKNLHHTNAYSSKTYQGGDILQEAHTHKFAWPFNVVVIWGQMTKLNALYLHLQNTHGHQMHWLRVRGSHP